MMLQILVWLGECLNLPRSVDTGTLYLIRLLYKIYMELSEERPHCQAW